MPQTSGSAELPLQLADAPLKTALLRHELPDGSWHVDWLIATDGAGTTPLISFRLPQRLDELLEGAAAMPAERIEDHRAAYLSMERGQVSGDRGFVTRIRSGRIVSYTPTGAAGASLLMRWDDDGPDLEQHLRLMPEKLPRWLIFCDRMRRW